MQAWYVFFLISLVGFTFLTISAFLGGEADADADAEFDFDADADVDLDADMEIDADADGDAEFEDGQGSFLSGWISTKVISALMAGLGLAGAGLSLAGFSWPLALAISLPVGWLFGFTVRTIMNYGQRDHGNSIVAKEDLLFQTGVVTQTILPGRVGEIEIKGLVRSARSELEEPLKVGAKVRVTELDDVLTVKPDEFA